MENHMKFQENAKVIMEEGEELLYGKYKPQVQKGRVEELVAGIDGGSTQTRCTFMRRADEVEALDMVYVIPSAFTSLTDAKDIVPDGEELYHMMDSNITNNILPPHNKFDKVRVLRGTKFVNESGTVARINSSVQKVNTSAFYINIIDCLAYSLIMDCANRNIPLAETYNMSIGCSLPPDDVHSLRNKETFIKSITGEFTWRSIELNVEIRIKIANVVITTEPEAAIKCHYMLQGEEIPEIVLGLDGGGRSIGSEILLQGKSFPKGSVTFPYGGTQLNDEISSKYVSVHGGTRPREESIKRSLVSGQYKRAKTSQDISDIIREVKANQGSRFYSDLITKVFDSQERVRADETEVVIFTGRYFGRGDYDCSVADVVIERFKAVSPDCEFIEITEEYMIPVGNAIIAFNNFKTRLQDNVVEINRLPDADELEDSTVTVE